MQLTPNVRLVETPVGTARSSTLTPAGSFGLLVLGHGAGGGIEAPDLCAARDAGLACGLAVTLVEQPWRVAGRRIAGPPSQLDRAWTAVLEALAPTGPLVLGGRSSGARVACRTASSLGAAAVLALAFPLVPPGSTRSRRDELLAPGVPRLVVQGERDAFGVPSADGGVAVHVVAGADHAFAVRRQDRRAGDDVRREVRDVVADWLAQTLT